LAFNPNGYYIASTSVDGTIKIADLRIGEILYTLKGHEVNNYLIIREQQMLLDSQNMEIILHQEQWIL